MERNTHTQLVLKADTVIPPMKMGIIHKCVRVHVLCACECVISVVVGDCLHACVSVCVYIQAYVCTRMIRACACV